MTAPLPTVPETLHFAYGSNLWEEQMQRRCPHHREIGRAILRGYRWIISARGYANVIVSPGDHVEGMLHELTPTDEAELDRHEGVAAGCYHKCSLPITIGEKTRTAMVYIDPVTAEGQPRAEYVRRINAGIKDAGLSAEYVRKYVRPFLPEDPSVESPAKQPAHAPIRG